MKEGRAGEKRIKRENEVHTRKKIENEKEVSERKKEAAA